MQTNKRLLAEDEKSEIGNIEQFYPRLQQYCQFLTQNKWDGDDLSQDAIVKAIKHYERSKINAALLKKIAYHHWVDTIRKRKRETTGIPENLGWNEGSLLQSSVFETVELVMENMTPKQAVVFILKEAFRFQSAEIAGILGMTEVAVKGSLHRAKRKVENGDSQEGVSIQTDEELQLSSLLVESLQAQDPSVLIEKLNEFPSLVPASKPAMALHSNSSLSFKMAA